MIDALLTEVDQLAGVAPAELADSETVVALQQALARLEAIAARVTTAWDSNGVWADDGARGAAVWLAHKTKLSKKRPADSFISVGSPGSYPWWTTPGWPAASAAGRSTS